MIVNENGGINLQSALNHLVDMGVQDPNILMQYAQNPPTWLGSNAGLLVNMAANMVGDQRQRAQAAQQPQGEQPTVMEQGIAKLAQPQQPMMPPQAPPQRMAEAPQEQPQMMAEGGLADLDTGDMYQEDSFATGGIVAFADGNLVEGVDYPDYTTEEESTSPFGRLIDMLDISGNVKKSEFGKRRERRKQLDEEIQKTVPTLIGGERGWFDKETKAQRKEYEDKRSALQKEKEKYPFFAPSAPVIAPTVDVKANPIKEEPKAKPEDKVTQIKKLSDENRLATKKIEEDELSSYDQALKRVMDAAKDDPYRQALRDQYKAEKEGAFYDVLGDIGTALVGAKKGQEGEALQKGFTAANARMKDLRKQQKDLTLAEQKADQEYKMLGIKYGFDSEQARAALKAKYKIQEMNDATEIKKYSILAGSKEGNLDFKAIDAVNKGVAKFLADNPLIAMNANKDPASAKTEEERQRIINAKKAVANKETELKNSFAQFLGITSGSKEDDDLISKYLKIK